MAFVQRRGWTVGLALGLLVGLVLGGLWPNVPLHAVATDHSENYAMATGFVDDTTEAVFVLDFLTGSLKGAVLSSQTAEFQARFEANVATDLGQAITAVNVKIKVENAARKKTGVPARPDVQMPQTPRFMLVTGNTDLRRGAARVRPGRSIIYVAETTTGMILAYAVPWSPEMHSSNTPFSGMMILRAADQFASIVTRTE